MLTRDRGISRIFILLAVFAAFLLTIPPAIAGENEIDHINRAIRNKGARWVAGETSVSRLPAEQRRMRLGLIEPAGGARLMPAETGLAASAPAPTLPGRLRYKSTVVTPVKDQGSCGSCWAFAVTAALESHVAMTTGELTDLSEQVLLSCSDAGVDRNPCHGGFPVKASDYIRDNGLPPESCLPYDMAAYLGSSRCNNACVQNSSNWKIPGWRDVRPKVAAMKQALYAYGPLVATLYVYDDFYSYTGGVYSYAYGQYQGGHVVEVIGYDDAQQCFIAKNSWGGSWGEAGYFNIAYSQVSAYGGVAFGGTTIAYDGTGTLQVSSSYQCGDLCTDPPDAQWRVDGEPWNSAAVTFVDLEAGTHTLEFMDNEGWTTPARQTVVVRKGKSVQAGGSYVLTTGALKVKIRPQAAADAGAQWQADRGDWRDSLSVASLLPGRHTVRFKTIDGWITPAKAAATTARGGQTTQVKGVYVRRTGSLTVTITPPKAVRKGARWRLDNGDWNASGAAVTTGIGQHTLSFSTVSDWSAPADQVLTVREGKTKSVSAAYTK
ncbi:MAG: C1 family peptidase [Syntrophobacter sp.]